MIAIGKENKKLIKIMLLILDKQRKKINLFP